jgi:hypothetical protein
VLVGRRWGSLSTGNSLLVFTNSSLQFGSEVADQTLNGPSSGVTQGANSVTFDLVGQLLKERALATLCVYSRSRILTYLKHINLVGLGIALDHTLHDGVQPISTLTARCALTARLVSVELAESANSLDNVG